MNRQGELPLEKAQQSIEVVIAVKLDFNAALLLPAFNPDPGAEMAGKILFQAGEVKLFRIRRGGSWALTCQVSSSAKAPPAASTCGQSHLVRKKSTEAAAR